MTTKKQIQTAIAFLRQVDRSTQSRANLATVKHYAEVWARKKDGDLSLWESSISKHALICAALLLGIEVKEEEKNEVLFGVKTPSLNRVIWTF
jgi:hypothetical protein